MTSRLLITMLTTCAIPAFADVPKVVTDIPPVHSLVSMVMEGVGTPELIIDEAGDPHHMSLRPSQATKISSADMVFWIGSGLTPWLETGIESLAPNATAISMMELEGTHLIAAKDDHSHHDHGDEHDDHKDEHTEHDHDDHKEDKHAEHDHDDHKEEERAEHDHDDHEEEHAEHEEHEEHAKTIDGEPVDPHGWLSPENAEVWLARIAEKLAFADPENAATYISNAKSAQAEMADYADGLRAAIGSKTAFPIITGHDVLGYFTDYFQAEPLAALRNYEAEDLSISEFSKVVDDIKADGITCFLYEPIESQEWIAFMRDEVNLTPIEINPLGFGIAFGPDHYGELMIKIGASLNGC